MLGFKGIPVMSDLVFTALLLKIATSVAPTVAVCALCMNPAE